MPTNSADYKFIPKESAAHGGATWCLECHPLTRQLPFISGTGCMYIQFKRGVGEERARQIANLLNESVEGVSVVD